MSFEDGVRAMPSGSDKLAFGDDDDSWASEEPVIYEGEPAGSSYSDKMRKINPNWDFPTAPRGQRPAKGEDAGHQVDSHEQVDIYRPDWNAEAEEDEVQQDIPADGIRIPATLRNDEVIGSLTKAMDERGVDSGAISEALAWYAEYAQEEGRAIAQGDQRDMQTGVEELRRIWGDETALRIGKVQNFLGTGPAGVMEALESARLGNGVRLTNDPEFINWIYEISQLEARKGAGPSGFVDDSRIAELEKYMREHRTQYMRDEAAQAELRTLYARREKRGR